MSRAARLWSSVALLAVTGALIGAPPAAAGSAFVRVTDSQFITQGSTPDTSDSIHFTLFDDAGQHTVTSDTGLFDLEFKPDTPRTYADGPRYLVLSPRSTVGSYHYHCKYHGKPGVNGQVGTGMAATLVVKVPWKSTTTTTQSSSTATSATTAKRETTTTSMPAGSATQASTSALPRLTTPTSRWATTSSTKPSSTIAPTASSRDSVVSAASAAATTTTAKKAESTPGTTEPEAAATDKPIEAALGETARQDGRVGEENSNTMLIVLGGLVALLAAGGGGWAWYHRASRYLPA